MRFNKKKTHGFFFCIYDVWRPHVITGVHGGTMPVPPRPAACTASLLLPAKHAANRVGIPCSCGRSVASAPLPLPTAEYCCGAWCVRWRRAASRTGAWPEPAVVPAPLVQAIPRQRLHQTRSRPMPVARLWRQRIRLQVGLSFSSSAICDLSFHRKNCSL